MLEKISPYQLLSLIVLFELGSAIVVGVGSEAGQDAWLVILTGMGAGLALFFLVYGTLYRKHPDLRLTQLLPFHLGKVVGLPLAFIYVLYFIYMAARVLRDFGDLLLTTAIAETPLTVIHLMILSIIAYASYLGIEVLGRSGEIFFAVMLLLGFSGNISVFASGIFKPENLLPVLENGWKPVLTTAFPTVFTFPFGEMIVFLMILPYINHPKLGVPISLGSILLSGIMLAHTMALNVGVNGTFITASSTFPLLNTIEKVNIGNFIQRLDAIVVATLIIGFFFKIAIFFYAAIMGLKDIFRLKKPGKSILPVALIILITSVQMSSNITEHLEMELKKIPYLLHLPLQVGIPVLLALMVIIRKGSQKERKSPSKGG